METTLDYAYVQSMIEPYEKFADIEFNEEECERIRVEWRDFFNEIDELSPTIVSKLRAETYDKNSLNKEWYAFQTDEQQLKSKQFLREFFKQYGEKDQEHTHMAPVIFWLSLVYGTFHYFYHADLDKRFQDIPENIDCDAIHSLNQRLLIAPSEPPIFNNEWYFLRRFEIQLIFTFMARIEFRAINYKGVKFSGELLESIIGFHFKIFKGESTPRNALFQRMLLVEMLRINSNEELVYRLFTRRKVFIHDPIRYCKDLPYWTRAYQLMQAGKTEDFWDYMQFLEEELYTFGRRLDLENWSFGDLDSASKDWHVQVYERAGRADTRKWSPLFGLEKFTVSSNRNIWEAKQLVSAADLYHAGRNLFDSKSYDINQLIEGRSSIWSVYVFGTDENQPDFTVEMDPHLTILRVKSLKEVDLDEFQRNFLSSFSMSMNFSIMQKGPMYTRSRFHPSWN